MTDIQSGITEQIVDKMFRLISTGAKSAQQLTEFAEWICSQSENKEMLGEIQSLVAKGEKAPVRAAAALDFSFDDLKKKLQQKNIKFNPFINQNTGKMYLIYTANEEARIRNAINEIYAEQTRTMEFIPYDFKIMNIGKACTEFKDIDETQLKIIRERAKNNKIVFTAEMNEKGFYNVMVRDKDTQKTYSMIKKINAILVGKTGENTKAEIQQNIDCIKKVRDMVYNKEKEFYVVSAVNPNNYIHITDKEYEHIKEFNKNVNGKESYSTKTIRKELSKDSDDFVRNISIQAQELMKPVILTPEEFSTDAKIRKKKAKEKYYDILRKNVVKEKSLSMLKRGREVYIVSSTNPENYIKLEKESQNLDEVLKRIENPVALTKREYSSKDRNDVIEKKYQGLIERSSEDKHKEYLEMRARQLIELKMSLDNHEQVENLSSFYNDEVSFHEFFEHEMANAEHTEEEIENIAKLENDFDCMSSEDQNYIKDYIREVDAEMIAFEEGREITEEDIKELESIDQTINRFNNTEMLDMENTMENEKDINEI